MAFWVSSDSLPTPKENKLFCRPRKFDFCPARNRNWTTVRRRRIWRYVFNVSESRPSEYNNPWDVFEMINLIFNLWFVYDYLWLRSVKHFQRFIFCSLRINDKNSVTDPAFLLNFSVFLVGLKWDEIVLGEYNSIV